MRLALISRPLGALGGIETATAGLLAALVKHGYRVDLLSTGAQGLVPGVPVRHLPVPRGPRLARLLGWAVACLWATRRGGWDLVQSHERGLGQDIYRAGEGTHRGYLAAMGRSGGTGGLYHRTVLALERRIFSLGASRAVVAISARGRAEIRRLYGTPEAAVHLIYNGVDLTRFHPENRPRLGPEVRRRLGLDAGHFVVAFVGSGFQRKGLDLAIEALALCRQPDMRLLVAGRGDAARYQAQAARLGLGERVLWLGPEPRVEQVYAAADLVALPARYEPFGNVHLEALASGVPVLSSRAAGGAEVIESGLSGWVVAEPTAAAVAEGLRALRESDAGSLAARARAAAEPFTHDRQVEALGRLCGTLAR